jgi:hypothetical protein
MVFEVANGTNPLDADSDDDGISAVEDVEWIQGSIKYAPSTMSSRAQAIAQPILSQA